MYKVFGVALIVFVLGSGPLHAQSVPGNKTPGTPLPSAIGQSGLGSAIRPVWEGQPGFGSGNPYYNPNTGSPSQTDYRPNERIIARPGTPAPTFGPGLGGPTLGGGGIRMSPLISGY